MKAKIIELFENLDHKFRIHSSDSDLEIYVDKLIKNASIISIIKNDILVGFIAFYDNDPNKDLAFLSMIIVNKESENLGYGKKLLELSLKEIENKGFQKYALNVHVENVRAIRLYENYGFIGLEIKSNFLYMEKRFSK